MGLSETSMTSSVERTDLDFKISVALPSTTFSHHIVFKIEDKITGPWNVCHWPTYSLLGKYLQNIKPISQLWYLTIKQSSKSLDHDICHWLTYVPSFRSKHVPHWTNIPRSITVIQIVFKKKDKSLTHIHLFYQENLCITWNWNPSYDICPSNILQDIRQNHWTMEYRSLTYIYSFRSMFVSHWSILTQVYHSSINQSSRYKTKS